MPDELKIGDLVEVKSTTDPVIYANTHFKGPNALLIGRQGRIVKFAMNEVFEVGWMVELVGVEGIHFFYLCELEKIDHIDNAPQIKSGLPEWWDDPERIKLLIFEVESGNATVKDIFGPFFQEISEVRRHLEEIKKKEQNNDL